MRITLTVYDNVFLPIFLISFYLQNTFFRNIITLLLITSILILFQVCWALVFYFNMPAIEFWQLEWLISMIITVFSRQIYIVIFLCILLIFIKLLSVFYTVWRNLKLILLVWSHANIVTLTAILFLHGVSIWLILFFRFKWR